MKTKQTLTTFFLATILMTTSCSTGSGGGGGGSSSSSTTTTTTSSTVTASESKTVTFDSSNPSIEVGTSVKKLTINGLSGQAGKAIYLAEVNNSSTDISLSNIRYVTAVSGITTPVYTSSDISAESTLFSDMQNGSLCSDVLDVDENAVSEPFSRTANYDSVVRTYNIGETKTIMNPESSASMTVKLLAKSGVAYVWGSTTDNYTESNFTKADLLCQRFSDVYVLDRTVFGSEPNVMFSSNSATSTVSIESISDTGTMVNIVLYKMSDTTMGLFSRNDFYNNSTSNKGKYFYLNSYQAQNATNEITLTMAHEFTHMIQFNQKIIGRVASGKTALSFPTAYVEMMADIAKDLVANYFEIGDTENAKTRFKTFNSSYFTVGMTGYDSSNYYYATNFAFGAWLCRNYGGARLAKEIMQNDSEGDDSIVAAVNSLNGTNYTMAQLIAQFVQAITASGSQYTLNKAVSASVVCPGTSLSSGADYNYTQSAINVFDLSSVYGSSVPTNQYQRFSMNGPLLMPATSQMKSFYNTFTSLKGSHGVSLHKIGTVSDGASSAVITFSETGSSSLTMYVIIGENRNIYGER
ncbi:MAG: hypothetical protein IJP61_12510 [Treponema sp.]|nr:hypothetical protein [Treponema sp.]